MSYHLSRAAAWYQHHGVAYVDAHTERENAYQPNAEILVLYTFLFAHRDTFAAAWQWLAELPTLVAIYMVARRLDFGRPPAVFAALLFAALSQTALQAVTTQNDLLAASLVASCVAFLASKERHRLWLAAVALGLALGTKLTVVFAFPAVVILAALLVPRREWKKLAGLSVLATAVFGAFGYVLNIANSGSLLGPQSATAAYQQHSWIGRLGTLAGVSIKVVLDPPFPNEDFSYFGPLGALVVAPVVVLTLRRWRQGRATALEAAVAGALPLYIVALAFLYRLNPWIGRFMLTPAALVAPLFASVYRNRHYAAAASAIATVSLGLTLLFNPAKPSGIGAGRSIWTMTRTEAQTVQRFRMGPVFATVAACVPEHARVGYVLGGDDWDYPLYGERLTRTIVRLHRPTPLRRADDLNLEWLLIRRPLVGQSPSHWSTMRFRGTELVLLQRKRSPSDVARHATGRCRASERNHS
jgi:4-amino-4-deoxy-L-arabinose transferase-like glycosyltransferase